MSPSRTALSAKCEFAVHREKAKSLFSSVNKYRAFRNVPTLTWDDTLYSYCVLHNLDMHGSVVKSSDFSMGHGYNENVAYVPGSSKKVMDLWNSRRKENDNLLCNTTKYSAIAVYGDSNECYATQIFMEQRPKTNDKVVAMKTHKKFGTCKSGKTITSQVVSSTGLKARSVASTKLRTKNSLSLVKKVASSKRPAKRSSFGRMGPTSNQPLQRNAGNMGQSIRTGIVSGMKSLGEALDSLLPTSNVEPSGRRPARRTERIPRACRRAPSSPHSLPYTFDRGSRPMPHVPRPIKTRNGYSRLNGWDEGYETVIFEECPFCKHKRSRKAEFCDTCSTYK